MNDQLGGLARTWGHRAVTGFLDLLLPPHCIACGRQITGERGLCGTCWSTIDFIGAPMCVRCGLPFDHDPGGVALCGSCAAEPPVFDSARAVMRYDDIPAALVIGLKHRDRTDLAPTLAMWLARAGGPLIGESDIVVPVPLHRRRLWARRYNQSALLAFALARCARRDGRGIRVVPDALRRDRATRSQGGLGRGKRFENVRGAFSVASRHESAIAGRRVLLIDDVMTTGATVAACAAALRGSGAEAVNVLVLARVLSAA